MNKVMLIGRIVEDSPKEVKNGYILSIAVKKNKEEADFIPVYLSQDNFGKIVEYLNKGKQIAIVGTIHSYKDKNGMTQLIVYANEIDLLGGGSKQADADNTDEELAPPPKYKQSIKKKTYKKKEEDIGDPPWD